MIKNIIRIISSLIILSIVITAFFIIKAEAPDKTAAQSGEAVLLSEKIYDESDRLVQQFDYQYDSLGRVIDVVETNYETPISPSVFGHTEYVYFPDGKYMTYSEYNNTAKESHKRTFDKSGRLLGEITSYDGEIIRCAYRYYEDTGKKLYKSDNWGQNVLEIYNDHGDVVELVAKNSNNIVYHEKADYMYDDEGKKISKKMSFGDDISSEEYVEFIYDSADRLCKEDSIIIFNKDSDDYESKSIKSTSYIYNESGNISEKTVRHDNECQKIIYIYAD